MKDNETNTEFLDRIMNFGCPTGALVQVFILQGLDASSKAVIASGAEKNDTPMVSGEAWVRTAEFVRRELDKHLKVK